MISSLLTQCIDLYANSVDLSNPNRSITKKDCVAAFKSIMSENAEIAKELSMEEAPKTDEKSLSPAHNYHHPTYLTMIKGALHAINNTKGCSKQAILKYIAQNYDLGENVPKINSHLCIALKKAIDDGDLLQPRGHGASGSFALSLAHNQKKSVKATEEPPAPKPKKVEEKPAAKKIVKKVKKSVEKKKKIVEKKKPKAKGRKPMKKAAPKVRKLKTAGVRKQAKSAKKE